MNKCAEYLELISAYADGELAEADKLLVEEHLAECENCSAILDLYRGASAAFAESCVPAPEELLGGVMSGIMTDGGVGDGGAEDAGSAGGAGGDSVNNANTGKGTVIRMVLTRYVPIAACLVLILLTVPRFLDLNRSSDQNTSGSRNYSTGETELFIDMPFDEAGGAFSSAGAMAGGGYTEAAESSTAQAPAAPPMPMPSAAPAPAPAASGPAAPAPPASAPEPGAAADDSDYDRDGEPLPEPGEAAPDTADTTANDLPEDDAALSPADETEEAPEQAAAVPENTEADDSEAGAAFPTDFPPFAGIPDIDFELPPEGFNLSDLIKQYERGSAALFSTSLYAIIDVKGGLPALMALYGLDPIDDVKMYFEIPRELAELLIGFIQDIDGVTVTIIDEDGEIAVLAYDPD